MESYAGSDTVRRVTGQLSTRLWTAGSSVVAGWPTASTGDAGTKPATSTTQVARHGGGGAEGSKESALDIAMTLTSFVFALVALSVVVWQCAGRSYARRLV